MDTKAILLDTQDYSERPNDPTPISTIHTEMREFCKRNNYTIVAEISSGQEYVYERDSPVTKLLHEHSGDDSKVVIVKLGKNKEQVEGDMIDPAVVPWTSSGHLRIVQIEHPCVVPPKDGNTRIWRYLSLPKFVDLLQSSSLHFTRADEMRKYDPSEGVSSTIAMKRLLKKIKDGEIDLPSPWQTRDEFLSIFDSRNADDLLARKHFMNCWHMSDHENFAMWKVYSEPYGVCIESRYENLKNSFTDPNWDYYAEKHKIYIGKVEYINSETQFIKRGNTFWTYLSKRREFSYENELRCIAMEWDEKESIRPKVDLSRLIVSIKLNPEAPAWYRSTVVDLCRKYNFDPGKISSSALSEY